MNRPNGSAQLDELRAANPVPGDVPSASLARVRARVLEASIADPDTGRKSHRFKVARPLAFAVVGGLLGLLVVAALGGQRGQPLTPTPSTGPIMGLCVEAYSIETLRHRSFAFDGTVIGIDSDEVTFLVNDAFRGANVERITLTAAGMTGKSVTSGSGPNLVVGQRYLVAGEDQFVWACGFTQPYDSDVAAAWADALNS